MAVHMRNGTFPAGMQGRVVLGALAGTGCVQVVEVSGQRRQGCGAAGGRGRGLGGPTSLFFGRRCSRLRIGVGVRILDERRHGEGEVWTAGAGGEAKGS